MATHRATSTSRSFYGSSSSTPGSKGPKPKWQRLSGLNLVKSLQVANGENIDDVDLSSDDEKLESTNNGGSRSSPQYDPTDSESGEEDPALGEGLELSFNLSMYSFEDPASLTDHSNSQSVSGSSTPATRSNVGSKKGGSATITPQSRVRNKQSEAVGSCRHARSPEQSHFRIT